MERKGRASLYNLEQRQSLLEEYNESGLSMKAFCESRELKLSTFKNWQLRKEEINKVTPSSFLQVKVKDISEVAPASPQVIRIVYPNGIKLEMPNQINPKELANIVTLLGVKI